MQRQLIASSKQDFVQISELAGNDYAACNVRLIIGLIRRTSVNPFGDYYSQINSKNYP
jgi:hypothetical protein